MAVAVTVAVGTTYVVAQQVLRADANDPQVQLAEDAAAQGLTSAAEPEPAVDVKSSLAPWIIVYGPDRRAVGGTARLDGKLPDYPISTFDNAPPGQRDQVTWQPEPGVRQATVVVGFKGGWVVAGRSLRLVEERINLVGELSLLGWLLGLAGTAGAVLVTDLLLPRLETRTRRK